LPLPDKPSLAVLPFQNISNDPEQEYFADGVAEDIITALARYPSLFVIARNSSFTYKARAVDVKQVGRDLGVRYVLEGSLRKAGNQIRVTAQLIEAATGNHLWADRYDRGLADIFAVQDQITEAVTAAVAPAIDTAERNRATRRPPENLDAWAAYQQARWHLAKVSSATNEDARRLFERAVQLDPMFAPAYAGMAVVYGYAGVHYRTIPIADALRLNLLYARKAIELDPGDADSLAELSRALIWQGDLENSIASARQGIAINPNCAFAHLALGAGLIFAGHTGEGRAAIGVFARLSPASRRDQNASDANIIIAQSYYSDHDYERCVAACQYQLAAFPGFPLTYGLLAAALGQLGRTDEARDALEKSRAMLGDRVNLGIRRRYHRPEYHAQLLEGYRKAGWSE
jgi:adenylate cyclase